ncbi:hypothetical protein bthur0014_60480 [Bacillus thuringiensis IBL 4222]|nr:hypothetical protein AS86_6508 [Bacillus thuringiensis HD1002]EEM99542.1 hypothetical protein bthur0014_60480 [Bacillus thuringiensis IBL 4222]RCX38701.1 hypothetical protein DEU45_106211 [Bacillus sp. AG102]TWE69606.1 hypothetical protein FHW38_107217 [Bacillus thuringiensis]
MKINTREWLAMSKEDRLLCIRLTVADNIMEQRKRRRG